MIRETELYLKLQQCDDDDNDDDADDTDGVESIQSVFEPPALTSDGT